MIHTITPEQFIQAQEVVKCIIQVAFHPNHEKDFLRKFCKVGEDWGLERMHMSGSTFRVTIICDDGRENDLYIPSEAVYSWYEEIGMKLKTELEK
jgi:hypothetical protein